MNKIILIVFIIWGQLTLVYADDFIVNSLPDEAEVFVRNSKNGEEVRVGKTPLKLPLSQLLSYTQERVFILVIKKHGHEEYKILMSNVEQSDVELSVKLQIANDITATRELDNLVSSMFEVQRLIRIKNYDQAITMLTDYEKKYPYYSIVHELLGSAYYLKKDFRSSLGAYRKAFSLNPDNMDAYRMKLYLEKSFNVAQVDK